MKMFTRLFLLAGAAAAVTSCKASIAGNQCSGTCVAGERWDANSCTCVCVNPCTSEGPVCDPLGSNQLGTCQKDSATGCYGVASLAPCAVTTEVCPAGQSACVGTGGIDLVVTGEYETFWRVNGRLYGVGGAQRRGAGANNSKPQFPPQEVAFPAGLTIVNAAGGLHWAIAADNSGGVWEWGTTARTPPWP